MIVNAHSMPVVPDSSTLGIPLLGLPGDLMSGIGLVHLKCQTWSRNYREKSICEVHLFLSGNAAEMRHFLRDEWIACWD